MAEKEDKKEFWEGKHYAFMQNRECEFFPCHKTSDPDNFNCLFCYCPLYALGKNCGGNFKIIDVCTKDCSDCLVPHVRKGYGYIMKKYSEITALVQRQIREAEEAEGRDACEKKLLNEYEE